jgi:hypothetical protein
MLSGLLDYAEELDNKMESIANTLAMVEAESAESLRLAKIEHRKGVHITLEEMDKRVSLFMEKEKEKNRRLSKRVMNGRKRGIENNG